MTASNFIDLTSQKFDRLTVISRAENSTTGKSRWNCLCICGTTCVRLAMVLKRPKHFHSCGCFNTEHFNQVITKHGMCRLPEYRIFYAIKKRCLNPRAHNFHRYGGRGIKICQRWMTFESFYADVGTRPSPTHSIDRMNNDGNYSCGKCEECAANEWPMNWRWATTAMQASNTRRNKPVLYEGQWISRKDLSLLLGIPYFTICHRIRMKLPIALVTSRQRVPRRSA